MPGKTRIFYSALLLTGVNLLLRLMSTAFQVFLSGRLGPAGVGLLQLVLSVGGMAITAGCAGIRTATMYLTAARLGAKQHAAIPHTLRFCALYSLACSGAVCLALFGLAPRIAAGWIGDSRTVGALRILALSLPAGCMVGVMTGYFTAAGRIRTLAGVEVAEQLLSMTVTVAALKLWAKDDPGRACQSVVLGSGLGSLFSLITLLLLYLRKKPAQAVSAPVLRQLLDTAVPLAVADDLKAGINTTENLMVPRRLALYPGVADPLATFGIVCGMVFPVLMLPCCLLFGLCELLIPEMARCNAAGSRRRIRYLARRSLGLSWIYGCFFSGILFTLAHPIALTLYGQPEAGRQLSLYALLCPILYCDAVTDAINKGLGQQKSCVRYNILTGIMDVVFLFLLLPRYGMLGYFISFFVTHLINFILSLRLLLKTAALSLGECGVFRALSASLCAIAISRLCANALLSGIAFSLSFFGLLTLLGVVDRSSVRWVKGLIK